jgi:hypothetical protein
MLPDLTGNSQVLIGTPNGQPHIPGFPMTPGPDCERRSGIVEGKTVVRQCNDRQLI